MAMADLHKGSYTGQFGFVYIEPASNPGNYDQEHFLALRDWEPFFSANMDDDDDDTKSGPQPEKPAVLNTAPNGLEVNSLTYSINDKSLGAGEPLRVKSGQRILFHLLNASAIENRRIAFSGHKFQVIALDGNPVPTPATVDAIFIGAGERVDAIVEMNNPGVWILGATEQTIRSAGLGLIVEYENQHAQPKWIDPLQRPLGLHPLRPPRRRSLRRTRPQPPRPLQQHPHHQRPRPGPRPHPRPHSRPVHRNVLRKNPRRSRQVQQLPRQRKTLPPRKRVRLKTRARYRLVLRNRTDDAHPVHLHRHQLELVDFNGKPTSGVIKDTVVVPFYGRTTVDFTANQPGLTLFHCHIQAHMDYGFKALFRYS